VQRPFLNGSGLNLSHWHSLHGGTTAAGLEGVLPAFFLGPNDAGAPLVVARRCSRAANSPLSIAPAIAGGMALPPAKVGLRPREGEAAEEAEGDRSCAVSSSLMTSVAGAPEGEAGEEERVGETGRGGGGLEVRAGAADFFSGDLVFDESCR